MEYVKNNRLCNILGKDILLDVKSGVVSVDGIDVTNDILELVVLAVEDSQTFILWGKKINISVCEV